MFSGCFTALITPFADGKLDERRLRAQVERQLAGGIDGLVPVGTTGESPTLTHDEHKRVIEVVVEAVAGRVPVVAGAGSNNTLEAIDFHKHARAVGAQAVLSVNPYYNKPSQEGLYRHFAKLSDEAAIPIVLYNIPGRTGITMTAETVARLHKDHNIAAIKEATGSMDLASQIMGLCDITVLSGDDSLTLPLMALGAAGVISVTSNLVPARMTKLTAAMRYGDTAEARKIHYELAALFKALFLDGNPAGIKYAMQTAGEDTGEVRLPLVEPTEPTKVAIRAAFISNKQ
ncbi:MAG: 4-hydroxy-tetrahydrodipicolinate synthase [Phycisphaerae bacterium]